MVARLAEITVDPKTVVLAKKVDASAVGVPKPAVDLQPGTNRYEVSVDAGGQQMSFTVTTSVESTPDGWTVTDLADTPGGQATEVVTLEKGTLIVRKRNIKQGPATIDLVFTDDKATGNVNINGQDHPVSADLTGPLFADGPARGVSLAGLPLAEGYTTTFRTFDVRAQKEKLMQLKVVGVESVTVPAGTFDSYKLELVPADGSAGKTTLWIAKDSRKPVKLSSVVPEMNGATITSELLP